MGPRVPEGLQGKTGKRGGSCERREGEEGGWEGMERVRGRRRRD